MKAIDNLVKMITGKPSLNVGSVNIVRTIVHKGNIAPKGHCFFVASLKSNGKIHTVRHTIKTADIDDLKEFSLRQQIADNLMKRVNGNI